MGGDAWQIDVYENKVLYREYVGISKENIHADIRGLRVKGLGDFVIYQFVLEFTKTSFE